jgi:hypothetical protein
MQLDYAATEGRSRLESLQKLSSLACLVVLSEMNISAY